MRGARVTRYARRTRAICRCISGPGRARWIFAGSAEAARPSAQSSKTPRDTRISRNAVQGRNAARSATLADSASTSRKNIVTGEAGWCWPRDEQHAADIKVLCVHGMTATPGTASATPATNTTT